MCLRDESFRYVMIVPNVVPRPPALRLMRMLRKAWRAYSRVLPLQDAWLVVCVVSTVKWHSVYRNLY